MDFHDDLMFPGLEVTDLDALFDVLGGAVIAKGFAREDYVEGLRQREAEFPTGLPISGGVAIPHTAAEYVTADTIVVATTAQPVAFGEMGGEPGATVDVSTVLMLVVADGSQQVSVLSALIGRIQQPEFIDSLRAATDGPEMVRILSAAFGD